MRDPYEVLGVAKNASAKDIKAAYRKLAKKHHPDQNPNDPKAKERFAAANQAYEISATRRSARRSTAARSTARASRASRASRVRPGGDPFGGFRRQSRAPAAAASSSAPAAPGGSIRSTAGDIFSQIFGDAFGQRAARPGRRGRTAPPAGRRHQRRRST